MATAGLFSMLGGDEAAMQRQLDEQRAAKFAEQTQEQRLAGMGYKAGAGLGRGLAGAFGVDVTDPTIRQAAELRRMASEYDVSSPDGLMQMAQALRGSNPQMAVQLAEKAQAMRKTMAETQAKTSEKLTPEQKNAAALADASGAERGTPEWTQAYKSSLTGLTAKAEAKISYGADAERVSKALFGTAFDKLAPEQADRVNKEVLKQEAMLRATGAAKQTVINAQETSFAKQRGELQAKSLADAETQAKASSNAVNRLTGMEKLNKGTMITGPLAGTAIGAGQFLSSLGLLSPDSAKTLSSSEVYDKLAKDLVMQDLGGKLGANISNADRDFIEARIPQLRNSAQARTDLIGKLKEIHSKNIDYYQRMSKHANAKGSLNDFDFASSAPDTGPALGTKENPIKLK